MSSLQGKVAILRGASRGIGRGIAERLGRDGASVVVTYAGNRDKAEEVVSAITAIGADAIALQLDLFKLDDIRDLVQTTISHFGRWWTNRYFFNVLYRAASTQSVRHCR